MTELGAATAFAPPCREDCPQSDRHELRSVQPGIGANRVGFFQQTALNGQRNSFRATTDNRTTTFRAQPFSALRSARRAKLIDHHLVVKITNQLLEFTICQLIPRLPHLA